MGNNNANNRRRDEIITGVAVGSVIAAAAIGTYYWNRPESSTEPPHRAEEKETTDEYVQSIPIESLLQDIHTHFVRPKEEDFRQYFGVFREAFQKILNDMYSISPYFERYAKQFQYSGSHSDNLKIGKPNEFDMNVVILVPISNKLDVKLEPSEAGFVMIKLNEQFSNFPKKPDYTTHHKVAEGWRDSENYFLQDKIRNWIESLFQQMLNKIIKNQMERDFLGPPMLEIGNIPYSIKVFKSGPAYTVVLKTNYDVDFCLHVDFVPVFEFQLEQLPPNFRQHKHKCIERSVFIVPKPMKNSASDIVKNRSWRVSFHEQEKDILYDSHLMRSTIRLIKKMRENLEMKHLSSYFIKTLFLWESETAPERFWNNSLKFLLSHMLGKLHTALIRKSIPYYWDERFNLLETLGNKIQGYDVKVKAALEALTDNDKPKLTKCFLNDEEYRLFRRTREQAILDEHSD